MVADLFDFGDFEDDALEGEADGGSGVEGAVQALFGFVDGVGVEVDAEAGSGAEDAESGRDGDGFLSAALIDGIAIVVQGVVEDGGGGLALRAAGEGFVGEDAAFLDVDDGLEGHGEGELGAGIAELAGFPLVGGQKFVVGGADGVLFAGEDLLERLMPKGGCRVVANRS